MAMADQQSASQFNAESRSEFEEHEDVALGERRTERDPGRSTKQQPEGRRSPEKHLAIVATLGPLLQLLTRLSSESTQRLYFTLVKLAFVRKELHSRRSLERLVATALQAELVISGTNSTLALLQSDNGLV